MLWRDAVLNALNRFAGRHNTRIITRQELIEEELDHIVRDTDSIGVTTGQTLSRVLQELRNEGLLYFLGEGSYLLLHSPIHIESEDLPDDAIDYTLTRNKLQLGIVSTGDRQAMIRQRRGQDRIRELVLQNYGYQCAFCDIADRQLLVTSHISRWADDPEARGNLANVICFCRFHDPLFEYGYLSLSNSYQVLKKGIASQTASLISLILHHTYKFRLPRSNAPAAEFLRKHRLRTGFEART